jgi:hypothetical protein
MLSTKSAAFYWFPVIVILMGIAFISAYFPIEPVSDFVIYWGRSTDLSMYIKGGGVLLLYAPFKYFNLPPSLAAMVVNLAAFFCFALAVWPIQLLKISTRWTLSNMMLYLLSIILVFCFGLIWWPMAGFTEVMFIHTGLLALSLRLIFSARNNVHLYLGSFLCIFALTMRIQSVLFLIGMISGAVVLSLVFFRTVVLRRACIAIFLSCLISSGIEFVLCAQSHDSFQVKLNHRTPLYTGLLVGNPDDCGTYHPPAHAAAVEEVNLPIATVVKKHLSHQPAKKVFSYMGCKLKNVFKKNYNITTTWWEIYQFDVKKRISYKAFTLKHMKGNEHSILSLIKRLLLLGSLLVLISAFANRTNAFYGFCYISWFLSVLLVFMIFEANPRYLIPVYGLSIWMVIYSLETVLVSRTTKKSLLYSDVHK